MLAYDQLEKKVNSAFSACERKNVLKPIAVLGTRMQALKCFFFAENVSVRYIKKSISKVVYSNL